MLQGVSTMAQKCHEHLAPKFLQGVTLLAQKCHHVTSPQGAANGTQKCQTKFAPASLIWCRDHLAEMPLLKRTKGRANIMSQKYQRVDALPNQFNGVIEKTQKCRDIVAPREGLRTARRNATRRTLFPNSHRGH